MARRKPPLDANPDLEIAKEALQPFLTDNPWSTLVQTEPGTAPVSVRVLNPWGDASFALTVPSNITHWATHLNQVRLPQRLRAIWHKDTEDLEVIWTAFNLAPAQIEIAERQLRRAVIP